MKPIQSILLLLCGLVRAATQPRGLVSAENSSFGVIPNLDARDPVQLNDQSRLFGSGKSWEKARSGTILAANDANFDAQFLNQPLNDYIVGAADPDDLAAVLESIAPSIPVSEAFSYRSGDTKEDFQTDSDNDADIREMGGDFPQVRKTGSQAEGRLDEKGLTMVIDIRQGGEEIAVQQRAVLNLRNRLFRSEIRRVITALDALDTAESSVNWGPAATTADPDKDVLDMLETSGDARGVDSNRVIFGGAWTRRVTSLRSKTTAGAFGTVALNPAGLADFYGVDSVVRLKTRYQSTSTAKAKVLTTDVYCYFAKAGAMPDDASNIKRFIGGSGVVVYVERRLQKVLVTVSHKSRIVGTSSVGVRKLPTTYT